MRGVCAHTICLVLYPGQPSHHDPASQGRDAHKLDHESRQKAGKGRIAHSDGIVERVHREPQASSRSSDGGISSKQAARGQLVVLAHGADAGRTRGRKASGRRYKPSAHADDAGRRRSK